MFLLLKILLLLLLFYLFLNVYLFYQRSKYRHFPSPPLSVSLTWFMGHLPDLQARSKSRPNRNFAQLFTEYHKDSGQDLLALFFFNYNAVYCMQLDVVSKIMSDNSGNFPKHKYIGEAMLRINKACGARLLGQYSLLPLPGGDIWRAKRRILDPAFKKSFLRTTMCGMNKVADDLVKVLEAKPIGEEFDITSDLNFAALEAVSVCGFDWDDKLTKEQGKNAIDMANMLVELLAKAVKQPLQFSMPWNEKKLKERFKNVGTSLTEAMKKHLEDRMEQEESGDILSHIIRSGQCSDMLDIHDLLDEYIVFLVAGMETTAITIATAIHFLSINPEICDKVYEEIDDIFSDKDELCYEDMAELEFLECVIKETLRMKGPVYGTWRACTGEHVNVEGVHFPNGTKIFIPFEPLQMDPRYWQNPELFNPERFKREAERKIRPFTFMPFAAGMRNCIGKNFAMLEMKIVLSNILRRFQFVNPYPELRDLPRNGSITLRPLNGVPMKIYHR